MNQLVSKAQTLDELLRNSGLGKNANQTLKTTSLLAQDNLGKEQTKELHDSVPEGTVLADTPAAENPTSDVIPNQPQVQNLNTSPVQALKNEGSNVTAINADGNPSGCPAQEAKTAAAYRVKVASLKKQLEKKASFRTGNDVLARARAFNQNSTEADLAQFQDDLNKLAAFNPVFTECRNRIIMRKIAEDIEAVAATEGVPPEDALEMLDAVSEANPAMTEDLEDEATAEAVMDLADAEDATGELIGDLDAVAAATSEMTGTPVTSDDLVAAAEQLVDQAEAQGVEPEALLMSAVEQMTGGEDISDEDMAEADALMEAAAAEGLSPDDVVELLTEELSDGGDEVTEEAVATEPAAEEAPAAPAEGESEGSDEGGEDEGSDDEGEEKAASLQKLPVSPRAALVSKLLRS